MRVLLAAGADPNAATPVGGTTPLHAAAYAGSSACCKVLLRGGALQRATPEHGTPLHAAARAGSATCCRALLRGGTALQATPEHGTPLHAAALGGDREVVEALLIVAPQHALERDQRGRTPLVVALQHRRLAAAGALLRLAPLPSLDVLLKLIGWIAAEGMTGDPPVSGPGEAARDWFADILTRDPATGAPPIVWAIPVLMQVLLVIYWTAAHNTPLAFIVFVCFRFYRHIQRQLG
ncbi:hypothetical protein ABPG75_012314 [Micractinium tetrahymenae]